MRLSINMFSCCQLAVVAAAISVAQAPARAAQFKLIDTVGETFNVNNWGGVETVLASQVWEVKSGILNAELSYQTRYVVASVLRDFWNVDFTWGPLSAGVTLKGTIVGYNIAADDKINWVRASLGSVFTLDSATAVLTPNCLIFCGAVTVFTTVEPVPYHVVPNAIAVPAPPGAPLRSPIALAPGGMAAGTIGAADGLAEGPPLRLDNYFSLGVGDGVDPAKTPIRFISEVSLREDGTYRYGYEVRNDSDDALDYQWGELGLAGTLRAHTSALVSFVRSSAPLETTTGAWFINAAGDEHAGPTGVFLPVPEPATVATLFLGLAVLASRLRSPSR